MKNNNLVARKVLLIMIFAHFVMMNIAYQLLAINFEFPEVLRYPIAEMLGKYIQNQSIIQPTYYLFTLTGLSFFVISFLIYESSAFKTVLGRLAMSFGCIAGLLTSFGFIRWTFVVPEIAHRYLANDVSLATKNILESNMSLIHTYAGVALGENLAFLLQGLWLFLLSLDLWKYQRASLKLVVPGLIIGLGIGIYSLEQFGGMFSSLGKYNILLQAGWLVWLLALSWALIKQKNSTTIQFSNKNTILFGLGYLGLLALV